jgi:carboxypeptidase C (cathepsin A)
VLTGESFAGKYLAYISKAILNFNAFNGRKIDIRNLVLSNPLVDVETERMSQH